MPLSYVLGGKVRSLGFTLFDPEWFAAFTPRSDLLAANFNPQGSCGVATSGALVARRSSCCTAACLRRYPHHASTPCVALPFKLCLFATPTRCGHSLQSLFRVCACRSYCVPFVLRAVLIACRSYCMPLLVNHTKRPFAHDQRRVLLTLLAIHPFCWAFALRQDDVMLDDIRKIDRKREPPDEGLMSEILWSDPQPARGRGV